MQHLENIVHGRILPGTALLILATLLAAGCGGGGDGNATSPPPPPPPAGITISGTVSYEFVPPNPVCQGLDFNSVQIRPIRGATVQLLDEAGDVLDSMAAGDNGEYSFVGVSPNTTVQLRVRAELKRTGTPSWDVEIRDNVVDPTDPTPPALGARALYTMVSNTFDSGTSNVNRNLTATTGWDGSGYTSSRTAAPFAILDAIYSAMGLIVSVDPTAQFASLDAFWSVNNTRTSSTDIDAGELGASFYISELDSLFLLGDASVDTEEFDDHVIVHEWGHYFEDNFSRSDSVGGSHTIGDRLDARLAFGEGWATALSGMALNNPLYCDTGPAGPGPALLPLGLDTGGYDPQGWYDEISIARFLYDLWDTTDDEGTTGIDGGSIGFAPIYNVMIGPQAFTETFTTIFSFVAELRSSLPPADQVFIDSQLVREDMTPGFDKWGVGELNDASPSGQQSRDVLPLYVDIPADGSVVNLCANDDYDGSGVGNKLAIFRYLRLNVTSTSAFDVRISTTTIPPDDPTVVNDFSDPDIFIFRDGLVTDFSDEIVPNEEIFTTPILTGPDIYVADLREYRYADPTSPLGFPDQMCFDVSFTPVP